MTNLEKLLANLGSDFENSNFEQNNFNLSDARQVLQHPAVTKALQVHAAQSSNGMIKHLGNSGDNSGAIHALVASSKGDLNLTVTRRGNSINAPLPFIMFGANDLNAGYISTLNGLLGNLPPGTTVAVSTAANGDIVFTYVNGVSTDTVTISNLGNINYKAFLASMNNNYFKTKYMLVSISDENQNLIQFAQPLFYGLLSSLGMTQANQVVFRSRTNSWQYRKDRIELVMPEQKITPDFSFAMSIVAVDNFSMGFDIFMSDRVNLNTAL